MDQIKNLTRSRAAGVVVAVSPLLLFLAPGNGRHDVDDGNRLLQVEGSRIRLQRHGRRNSVRDDLYVSYILIQ